MILLGDRLASEDENAQRASKLYLLHNSSYSFLPACCWLLLRYYRYLPKLFHILFIWASVVQTVHSCCTQLSWMLLCCISVLKVRSLLPKMWLLFLLLHPSSIATPSPTSNSSNWLTFSKKLLFLYKVLELNWQKYQEV